MVRKKAHPVELCECGICTEVCKKKSRIRAIYPWPGHFAYDVHWDRKAQLIIHCEGWIARLLGFILRAKDQY